MSDGTFNIFSESSESGSDFSVGQLAEMYKLLCDSNEPKRKKKKKGGKKKKGKKKKLEKAYAYFHETEKKGKKKAKARGKGKKQAQRELQHQLYLTAADTLSYGAKRFFDHKYAPSSDK